MIFGWWKRRRRRKLLSAPFPPEWKPWLDRLPFYGKLSEDARAHLRRILRVLAHEKRWEGAGGLEMTDEVRVTIAAQAALLLLGIEHDYFCTVRSIFVYPSTFTVGGRRMRGGHVEEGGTPVLGLAHYRGPLVLAWDSCWGGAANAEDGRNVVLHEFAHKLDLLDAYADGTPELENTAEYKAWTVIMTREYAALVKAAEKGRRSFLDKYGATNPAEFFAVGTEAFFEKGRHMKRKHPELYEQFRVYYKQDSAAWGRVST